jgi:hypothetical protein
MINISYNRTLNQTGVEVGNLTPIGGGPVKVLLKNIISKEIHFTHTLNSNTWCKWSGAELITDILIYDVNDNLIHKHQWDILSDGDEIEKSLWFYLKSRKERGLKSNGLVIGTHDGRNGHWIYPVKQNLSTALLIDGSEKQFSNLTKNYEWNSNVKMINTIVTPNGGNVVWYQGGEGYTDTVVSDLIHDWLDDSQITKVEKESISFVDLTNSNNFDWIHLDVEGIDGDLILSLEKLPNVIVYESMNLNVDMEIKLKEWFDRNGYITLICNGNTMATKINQSL